MDFRDIRKLKSFSQIGLANKLSVKQVAVSHWETGKREPPLQTIVDISKIFNCSIDEVVLALLESKKQHISRFVEKVAES